MSTSAQLAVCGRNEAVFAEELSVAVAALPSVDTAGAVVLAQGAGLDRADAGCALPRSTGEISSAPDEEVCPQTPPVLRGWTMFTLGSRPLFSRFAEGVFNGTGASVAVGAAAPPIDFPTPLFPLITAKPGLLLAGAGDRVGKLKKIRVSYSTFRKGKAWERKAVPAGAFTELFRFLFWNLELEPLGPSDFPLPLKDPELLPLFELYMVTGQSNQNRNSAADAATESNSVVSTQE